MKTFEDIVHEVFHEEKLGRIKRSVNHLIHHPSCYKSKDEISRRVVNELYERSRVITKQPDISEPIATVCKLMLENHNRFHLEKQRREKLVIVDKFTKQKFVSYRTPAFIKKWSFEQKDKVVCPSFLTEDEGTLLAYVMGKWFSTETKILSDKRNKCEQQRKDKCRQEMVDLYKEGM